MIVDAPIYGRIEGAIAEGNKRSPHGVQGLYLGISEWEELSALCAKWGHDWPPGGADGYHPQEMEAMRAKFLGKPIYRVDAQSHLLAA